MSECYDYRHMRDRAEHCYHEMPDVKGRYVCCWCAQVSDHYEEVEHGPALPSHPLTHQST